jgi:SAM-dependent methyltransferase
MMSSEPPDFDAMYRGESQAAQLDAVAGLHPVPWDIGEPQPAVAALERGGRIRGPVLDAGCGTGETTLFLAARGFDVVGVDSSPTAIAAARAKATERGLGGTEFTLADILSFDSARPRFATVVDSTLYHSLPVSAREPYFAAMHRVCRAGATLFILCFSEAAPFPPEQSGPHQLSEADLRDAFGGDWVLDELAPARISARMPPQALGGAPSAAEVDERGRARLPAWLASAHRNDDVPEATP